MPEEVDRALARLVVESGLLTRDEAAGYWRQTQAPGSPRFVAALLQSGRITQAEVERLRTLYQAQQGSGNGPSTGALPRPATGNLGPAPGTNSYGPPPGTNTYGTGNFAAAPGSSTNSYGPPPATGNFAAAPGGTSTTNNFGPPGADALADNEGTWEEQVARDAQLARVLYTRGLTTQDRLRECRELQLKHRARLGVVLVKKGYVERAAVTEALAAVRGPASAAPGTPQGATPLGPILPPPASARHARPDFGPPPGEGMANPFAVPAGGPVDQDAMPTLNVGPGGIPGFPGRGIPPGMTPPGASPQDAIATITGVQSIDEMNPFASVSAPGAARPAGFPGMPLQPMLSGDELNAFENVPLTPVGSVRGGPSPLLQSTRGGSNPVNGWGPPPGGAGTPPPMSGNLSGPSGFDMAGGPGTGQGMFATPPVIGGHGTDSTQGPAAGAEHAPPSPDLISSAAQKSKTKSKAKKTAEAPGMSTGKLLGIVVGAGLLLMLVVLGLLWAIL